MFISLFSYICLTLIIKTEIMITTLELLNQVQQDLQTDFADSLDREEAIGLIDELIIKLTELK